MAFIVHANVPAGDVPELEVLRASARGRLEMPVHIDERQFDRLAHVVFAFAARSCNLVSSISEL